MENYIGSTINEMAERLGVNPQTLRKWEKDYGLKIPRNEKGHRFYTEKEVELLESIQHWKGKGASTKAILNYLGRTDEFKEQKEQALELITMDKLTGAELKELMAKQFVELMAEEQRKLKEEFEQVMEEKLRDQEQKIREQIKAENRKLLSYIEEQREEEKKGFWSKLFK